MKNRKIIMVMFMTLSIVTIVACTNDKEENQSPVGATDQNLQVEDNVNSSERIITTKIEGRRQEFIQKLDNIQKELDALPEKRDSDAGVTNAMRSYYGKSYDMYDEALNKIYILLQDELSPEIMKNLQIEQIKWIKQKEDRADKERLKFQGGTHEFVAYNVSLYESTKERCYELVNEYMSD